MTVKDNRGATLVELMVSVAIFGIIASAALGLLLYATNINSDVTADVAENSRIYQALDVVKEKAHEAEKLEVSATPQGDITLKTQITAVDGSGNTIILSDEFVWIRESGTVTYKPVNGTQIVLLEGIKDLKISGGNDEEITENPTTRTHIVLTLTTEQEHSYEITIVCKNG